MQEPALKATRSTGWGLNSVSVTGESAPTAARKCSCMGLTCSVVMAAGAGPATKIDAPWDVMPTVHW
jgi:hypothetical protein